jgi:hypothetical protein
VKHILLGSRGRPVKIRGVSRGYSGIVGSRSTQSNRSNVSPSDSNITPSRPTSAMSVSSQGSSGSSHGGSRSGSGRPSGSSYSRHPAGPGRRHKSNILNKILNCVN